MHVCHYSKCTNGKSLNGISSVTDSSRPGQAHWVVTPEAIAAVEAIVKENCHVTIHEIAAHLNMSHGSAHHIVRDVLQFHKVSAKWVPYQLTAELKEWHVDACQELLKRFEAEGDGFVEELLLEMKPGSNITSRKPRKRARNGTIPPHQNRKNSAHNLLRERLCWLSFWNERGVILEHYMPRGNTVTSATYADLKNHLHPAIKSKWCGLLSTGVLLQMTVLGPILPVQLLQQSKICPLSVFDIRRTRQTSHQVIFTSLDHSKRRWEACLSGPTKRCSRWYTSGCTLRQKTFF